MNVKVNLNMKSYFIRVQYYFYVYLTSLVYDSCPLAMLNQPNLRYFFIYHLYVLEYFLVDEMIKPALQQVDG